MAYDHLTREIISTALGYASIVAWLFAQVPQLLENWRNSSVEGLALPFLVSWLAGDAMNLVGCLLTHQLPFQTYLASYFVLVDVGLCSQFIYYSSSATAIPPLSATYPHVHTPRPSYLRSHTETWHTPSSHRRSSRKSRTKSGTNSGRGKSTSVGVDDPMERSWMSESSVAHSPASSRPQTVAPRSHFASHPASSAGTESLSPAFASTSTLPERGRTLTRPPPPRPSAFFSTMETISGSPASESPGPALGHVHGMGIAQAVQEGGAAHGVHPSTRSTSRSRPPPAARRSSSMVFLSVGLLVGFGKWSAGSVGSTEVGKAWSVSKPELVESRSDWGAGWSQARHPTFFGPAFAPLAQATLSRRQHARSSDKRQVFPLSVSIVNSPLPSNATTLSDEDYPAPPKQEPDEEEEPYPYPRRDWERFVGRASAWMCTTLYLTSRLPQIWQNFRRRSVEGLSMLLFVMAFVGNSLYVLSIVTNPLLQTPGYLLESTPYLLGSGGTLCFDITIVLQSFLYSPKRMERLERNRRKMGKYSFDSEEAAALLDEDETDEETAGRRSRSVSLGGGRSRSSRRPISRKRSDSTELGNTRRQWSSAGATPYAREESSPVFATQEELDALSHRDFDFGGARHGGEGHEVVEIARSRSMDVSRSRTRPTSIIEEEGESGVTIRG